MAKDVTTEIRDILAAALTTQCNLYYAGFIETPPLNHMTVLCVYPTKASTGRRSTCEDRDIYEMAIDLYTSAFTKVNSAVDADLTQQAQSQLWDLMEERDANGVAKATSVLGALRRNIRGTTFSYTKDYVIDYSKDTIKVDNKLYFKGTMTFLAERGFTPRS